MPAEPPTPRSGRWPRLAPLAAVAAIVLAGVLAVSGGSNGAGRDEPPDPVPSLRPAPPRGFADLSGRVTDGANRPVPGAVLRLRGGRSVRTDARGSYRVRVRLGRQPAALTAERPGHVPHRLTIGSGGRRRIDFALWPITPKPVTAPDTADRIVFWSGCEGLVDLSASEVRELADRGVGGFVCQIGRLEGMGGKHSFARDGRAPGGQKFALQRRLSLSPLLRLRKELDLKLYLGFYLSNYFNASTPLAEWFDDRSWRSQVLPQIHRTAGAARSMGFAGVALDQELYRGRSEGATWDWDHPGRRRGEAAVRAKVKQRGAQSMQALTAAFPGLDLIAYHTKLPGSWEERVQADVNGTKDAYADTVQTDFWDGLLSARGYGIVRWFDAAFYKAPNVSGSTWAQALQANARAVYGLLSREVTDWSYAAPRLNVTPFGWIDSGSSGSDYERARPSDYVADQLAAFRQWGTGGEFGVYGYRSPADFDYGPYADGLRTASEPGRVDSQPPTIAATTPAGAPRLTGLGAAADVAGTATDNFAVRSVTWRDARGAGGSARVTPDGPGAGVRWQITALPVSPGENPMWLRVEDIKGNATLVPLTLVR